MTIHQNVVKTSRLVDSLVHTCRKTTVFQNYKLQFYYIING